MRRTIERPRIWRSRLTLIGVWISLCAVPGCFPPAGPEGNEIDESSKLLLGSENVQYAADIADLVSTKMEVRTVFENGKLLDEILVAGYPPVLYREPAAKVFSQSSEAAGAVTLPTVPAFRWCYGCSATAAGMIMGYYDNIGYSNMYAGPANGGVCPMNNATTWGTKYWSGVLCGECPFVASRLGLENRTIRGHVDDYWIALNNEGPDPFITGGWPEHAADCTGDFMGTNQSQFACTDGGTIFYYHPLNEPLKDYTGCEPGKRDGCHGIRLFAESRGYTVTENFSQYIAGYNGRPKGFSFDNFKSEINAGRPVIIQVMGHSMVGFGYDLVGNTIYVHDTWDASDHTMTWGGSYTSSGQTLQHYAVIVLRLAGLTPAPTVTSVTPNTTPNTGPITITDLAGTGFSDGATVTLVLSGQPDIVATSVVWVSSTKITCTVDLTGAAAGNWNVMVANPDGQTGILPDGLAVTVPAPPGPGDANNDGKVDVSDLGILAANYGMTSGAVWSQGDFNNDGKVDVSDLGILAANYGTGTGSTLDFNQDVKSIMK